MVDVNTIDQLLDLIHSEAAACKDWTVYTSQGKYILEHNATGLRMEIPQDTGNRQFDSKMRDLWYRKGLKNG
jgi:hypothetical protein